MEQIDYDGLNTEQQNRLDWLGLRDLADEPVVPFNADDDAVLEKCGFVEKNTAGNVVLTKYGRNQLDKRYGQS